MFQYLSNIPLEQALEEYLTAITQNKVPLKTERVPVPASLGRYTACAVYARISVPHYNACAMDGVAVSARLTFGASETTPVQIKEGDFIPVDTGDPLPETCDCVVMIEDVVSAEDGSITLFSAATPWQHVRQIGEDICAEEMIVPSFTKITPSAMGAMLAAAVLEVDLVKKPLVGIIPTGDEIVPAVSNPETGKIIEFNSTIFSAMFEEWGIGSVVYPVVKDKFDDITAALKKAVADCDLVILNAGSSAGREDFSSKAIAQMGTLICHGIAIKPGKPAILGLCGNKPVIGVPGYPVSGIIVLEYLIKPVIALFCGGAISEEENMAEALLSRKLNSSLKYREFVRTRLGFVEDKLVAVPLNRGAGVISSFVKADGIIDIPQNREGYEAGEKVNVRLLKSMQDIKQMLVITGSHDPLIDEATDLMKQSDSSSLVASSHVGSMGGILAIHRREAHLGGIHLLSEKDGSYNSEYLRTYFKPNEVVLVEGVKRVQGLITAKGNPKNIKTVGDLVQNGIRFVNRQNGSGTRILLDFLLKREGIDQRAINGYEREEFTHTGVAVQIAAGSADCGLGIFSAAKIYNLNFIPLCDEEYDFLVLESAFKLPAVKHFIDTLKSSDFKERLARLGGYSLENPGKIKKWN